MTMIEKVARAIDPVLWTRIDSDPVGLEWMKEASLERARTAIEVMREPTEAMLQSLACGGWVGWQAAIAAALQ